MVEKKIIFNVDDFILNQNDELVMNIKKVMKENPQIFEKLRK